MSTRDQQAMWDALAILGFDTDGDTTPGACVAGMGDDGFRRMFIEHMRQERADHDEALDEGVAEARVADLEAGIRKLANGWDDTPPKFQTPVGRAYAKCAADLRALVGDETPGTGEDA